MVSERRALRWRWCIVVDGIESSCWNSLAVARDYCDALRALGWRAELMPVAWLRKDEGPGTDVGSEPRSQPERQRP